jgi:hypothetical protein
MEHESGEKGHEGGGMKGLMEGWAAAEGSHGGAELALALGSSGLSGLTAHGALHGFQNMATHGSRLTQGVHGLSAAAGIAMAPASIALGVMEMLHGGEKMMHGDTTEGGLDALGGGLSAGAGAATLYGSAGALAGWGGAGAALAAAPWLALGAGGLALGRYGAEASAERGYFHDEQGNAHGSWAEGQDWGASAGSSVANLVGGEGALSTIADYATTGVVGGALSLGSGVAALGENLVNW